MRPEGFSHTSLVLLESVDLKRIIHSVNNLPRRGMKTKDQNRKDSITFSMTEKQQKKSFVITFLKKCGWNKNEANKTALKYNSKLNISSSSSSIRSFQLYELVFPTTVRSS